MLTGTWVLARELCELSLGAQSTRRCALQLPHKGSEEYVRATAVFARDEDMSISIVSGHEKFRGPCASSRLA